MRASSRAAAAARTISRSCARSHDFLNLTLVEQPNGDFGDTIVRQFLFDAWQLELYERLAQSKDALLAAIAGKGAQGDALSPALQRGLAGPARRRHATRATRACSARSTRSGPTPASSSPTTTSIARIAAAGIAPLPSMRSSGLVGADRRGAARRDAGAARAVELRLVRQAGPAQRAPRLPARRDAVPAAHLSRRDLVSAMSATGAAPHRRRRRRSWRGCDGILAQVPDPEIPVLSVLDLGVDAPPAASGRTAASRSAISPTYSGCPATAVIKARRRCARCGRRASTRERGRRARAALDQRLDERRGPPQAARLTASRRLQSGRHPRRLWRADAPLPARAAARSRTTRQSEFGSTPCKALYRCDACLEPFDHFKCI